MVTIVMTWSIVCSMTSCWGGKSYSGLQYVVSRYTLSMYLNKTFRGFLQILFAHFFLLIKNCKFTKRMRYSIYCAKKGLNINLASSMTWQKYNFLKKMRLKLTTNANKPVIPEDRVRFHLWAGSEIPNVKYRSP